MSKNGSDHSDVPMSVWILAAFFALYSLGMLILLWRRSADSDDVAILNTVAAIVAAPVGGLIALAVFISGRGRTEVRSDGCQGEERAKPLARTALPQPALDDVNLRTVEPLDLVRSPHERESEEQPRDELHSKSDGHQ